MTIRHLKLFTEVYRTLNVTKAAENLNMTQPTVTRAIQELEDHYGTKFFDRINKRLNSNEAGNKFYSYAMNTLEAYDHMEAGMLHYQDNEVIRVGATLSIGSIVLPKIIKKFKELYPEIQIKSFVNNTEHLQEMISYNQIDFALMEGYAPVEHICSEVFSEDRLVLLLPPEDPRAKQGTVSLETLKNDNFLLREKGSVGRNYVDVLFSSHGFPIEPVMESISTHAIVRAVNAGIGVSILPKDLVEHGIMSGYVSSCEIEDIDLSRQNYIVWHEDKYLTDKMKELMTLCKNA